MEKKETAPIGCAVDRLESIDSTNAYLQRAAQKGAPEGLVAVASRQTMGRGRCGRDFQSPAGKGLYLSVLLRPQLSPQRVLPITALCAVAACNAVERVSGVRAGIKWTNDLVLNGRKLAGILVEMDLDEKTGALRSVVIGIGINANQLRENFSGDVAEMATSLRMETGKEVDLRALEAALIDELNAAYDALKGVITPFWEQYRRDCITLGREVRILGLGVPYTAWAEDITEDFSLVVRKEDGTRAFVSCGEVSVRGLYGYV